MTRVSDPPAGPAKIPIDPAPFPGYAACLFLGMNRVIPTSAFLSLCLAAVACSPEAIDAGFGDSAAPDILPDESTGPADPTPDEGDASSSSGGDSSGGEDQASAYPACLDRDPMLTGEIILDFGAWGSPDDADERHIDADCFSTDFSWDFESHAAYIELRCSEGDLLDEKITAVMDLGPYPFLEVPVGSKFHFQGGWVNNKAEAAPYQYFIIQDEISHDVQVAALINVVEDANDKLGIMHLDLGQEMCPWVCESDCADGGTPITRSALVVSKEQTELSVQILDGQRGAIQFLDITYEVVVGRLQQKRKYGYSELDSAIVIASTPIY